MISIDLLYYNIPLSDRTNILDPQIRRVSRSFGTIKNSSTLNKAHSSFYIKFRTKEKITKICLYREVYVLIRLSLLRHFYDDNNIRIHLSLIKDMTDICNEISNCKKSFLISEYSKN